MAALSPVIRLASTSSAGQVLTRFHSVGLLVRLASTSASKRKSETTDAKQKEHFNIGTIGHIDHGKTTLTAAITKVLAEQGKAKYVHFDEIDKAAEERKRGITMNIAHVAYETEQRHYAHTDCPGHRDFLKNMITGTAQMDAAILVVGADDGAMPQTKEHLHLAKHIGVKDIVVFINKADKVDEDMLDLVELDMRELLTELGFSEGSIQFVRGSALCALDDTSPELGQEAILRLITALDKLRSPTRDVNAPFRMPVTSALSVTGRGTVAIGTVESGRLKKRDPVELIGFGDVISAVATDLHVFHKSVPEIQAGDHVGVLCRGLKLHDIRRGKCLCGQGTMVPRNSFRAKVYVLTSDEGGLAKPLKTGFNEPVYCGLWNCISRLFLPNDVDMLMPGDDGTIGFLLWKKMPILPGSRFTVRAGGGTALTGVVTELLSDVENLHRQSDFLTAKLKL